MKGHGTRDRVDRQQVNVILDAGLVAVAKRVAADRGVSLTRLVAEALEVAVHGHVGVGSDGGVGADFEVAGVGPVVGGDRERGAVADPVGRRVTPDWDAILAAGARPRRVEMPVDVDPLVEIA